MGKQHNRVKFQIFSEKKKWNNGEALTETDSSVWADKAPISTATNPSIGWDSIP
jgi:hypothetical protein